jgi:hypothetical protein
VHERTGVNICAYSGSRLRVLRLWSSILNRAATRAAGPKAHQNDCMCELNVPSARKCRSCALELTAQEREKKVKVHSAAAQGSVTAAIITRPQQLHTSTVLVGVECDQQHAWGRGGLALTKPHLAQAGSTPIHFLVIRVPCLPPRFA